ncbi:MAG: LON peptidase substrate-binding domain-containing protein [Roseiflexaceae bacterium]|nr:LON peptidase substrate-binding domain-containing protein [Roseiflexus sp.]MDW8211984.1 LON peptidase substrate-binding domain-containing protein [Roseiflexaceae bacterium]
MKLPLFPLHTVLFPGAPISLHIFEERYRLMIGQCLAQHQPFGVVLLRSGSEVSPDDPFIRSLRRQMDIDDDDIVREAVVPYEIGTIARITESQRFDDGRYLLIAVGQRRFRVQYIMQHQPYIVASVTQLAEDTSTLSSVVVTELRQTYERYWKTMTRVTGRKYDYEELPVDAVELSYWLAHRLYVDNQRKQRWLESDVATRLREMTGMLKMEIAMLPRTGHRRSGDAWPWSWN